MGPTLAEWIFQFAGKYPVIAAPDLRGLGVVRDAPGRGILGHPIFSERRHDGE
jgi:hypothetical protein